MAEKNVIARLDHRLIEEGLVDPAFDKDYPLVHRFLNSHLRKNGKILTEETFQKGNEALRSWLTTLFGQGASQEKLTSYLRIGLAHLSFDFIESGFSTIGMDDLISRTLVSFKKRGFQRTFFRADDMNKSIREKRAKTSKKKGTPVKKATKKKAVKKTAAKKKITKKKVTAKKKTTLAAKKKAVKKKTTVAKKKGSKKTASKKKS